MTDHKKAVKAARGETRPPVAEADKKQWFRFEAPRAEADGTTSADVYVYDVIDSWWGIDAQDFVQNLASLDVQQINLYVNSPGGNVFDATAMQNALRRHPANVTAHVDGLAASAASFLLTAANEVVMGMGSTMMIHDAWSVGMGSAQDLRDTADVLDQLSQNIAALYASKAGGTADDWRQVMLDETWYTADEAVESGLADRVEQPPTDSPVPQNVFDLSVFAHAGREDAPEPPIAGIRAAALAHPRDGVLGAAARTKDRTAAPAAVKDAGEPAEKEGAQMSPTVKAPTESTEDEVAAVQPVVPQASAFDLDAARALFREEFAAAIVNTAPSVIPGVPGSFAAAKSKEPSFQDVMRAFTNQSRKRETAEEKTLIKSVLTTAGDVWDALSNVSFGDATAGGLVHGSVPQWINELVTRYHIPGAWELINHADMTNPVIQGFVLQTEPTGGTKGDGGGAVVSTGAKWVASTTNASRWAGADSFDRMAFDFGIQADLLESYFRVQFLNYQTWREGVLLAALTSGASVTYNNAAPASSSITQVVNQILTGMVNVFTQSGALANIAVVTSAQYLSLIRNSQLQAPAFITIDAGQLTEGEVSGKITVRPDATATLTTGQVLVAAGSGITGYELPAAPVRAEQIQVTIGNIDVGLFGYAAAVRDSVNFVSLVGAGS